MISKLLCFDVSHGIYFLIPTEATNVSFSDPYILLNHIEQSVFCSITNLYFLQQNWYGVIISFLWKKIYVLYRFSGIVQQNKWEIKMSMHDCSPYSNLLENACVSLHVTDDSKILGWILLNCHLLTLVVNFLNQYMVFQSDQVKMF